MLCRKHSEDFEGWCIKAGLDIANMTEEAYIPGAIHCHCKNKKKQPDFTRLRDMDKKVVEEAISYLRHLYNTLSFNHPLCNNIQRVIRNLELMLEK